MQLDTPLMSSILTSSSQRSVDPNNVPELGISPRSAVSTGLRFMSCCVYTIMPPSIHEARQLAESGLEAKSFSNIYQPLVEYIHQFFKPLTQVQCRSSYS